MFSYGLSIVCVFLHGFGSFMHVCMRCGVSVHICLIQTCACRFLLFPCCFAVFQFDLVVFGVFGMFMMNYCKSCSAATTFAHLLQICAQCNCTLQI